MMGTPVSLSVKVFGQQESVLTLTDLAPDSSMAEVAAQVRKAHNWDAQQHMRFISSGAELFMDDSVSKALGSVLHCIASQSPAQKYPAGPKAGSGQKGVQHSPAADWLEMVDPGTVLMWIFGSILALLWLLFICYAHMFDRTSVIMLCLMTIAFLIPCVLSLPALRMLHGPSGFNSLAGPRHSSHHHHHHHHGGHTSYSSSRGVAGGPASTNTAVGGGWSAYSTTGGSYTGAIPPRPHARVRPGQSHPAT